jgi:hypothetical protein
MGKKDALILGMCPGGYIKGARRNKDQIGIKMSQPEAMCHKGTPQSSQMIKMADMISDLEDQLAAVEASLNCMKASYVEVMQKLDRKTVECDEARKLAGEQRDARYNAERMLYGKGNDGRACKVYKLPWEEA